MTAELKTKDMIVIALIAGVLLWPTLKLLYRIACALFDAWIREPLRQFFWQQFKEPRFEISRTYNADGSYRCEHGTVFQWAIEVNARLRELDKRSRQKSEEEK